MKKSMFLHLIINIFFIKSSSLTPYFLYWWPAMHRLLLIYYVTKYTPFLVTFNRGGWPCPFQTTSILVFWRRRALYKDILTAMWPRYPQHQVDKSENKITVSESRVTSRSRLQSLNLAALTPQNMRLEHHS